MAKRKKGVGKKRTTRRKRGRRPGLAGMSVAQLEAAIARRKAAEAKKLKAKRAKLMRQVASLDKEIGALTGAAPKRGRGGPKRKVARKKRGRRTKKVARKKTGRVRSTAGQIARVQNAVLKALKGKSKGLLKVEIAKAVRGRGQTLNTALKHLLASKKIRTKGVTRNMRYILAK